MSIITLQLTYGLSLSVVCFQKLCLESWTTNFCVVNIFLPPPLPNSLLTPTTPSSRHHLTLQNQLGSIVHLRNIFITSRARSNKLFAQRWKSGMEFWKKSAFIESLIFYWKSNFPVNPHVCMFVGWLVGPFILVGWLVGRSVINSYRSNCLTLRYIMSKILIASSLLAVRPQHVVAFNLRISR